MSGHKFCLMNLTGSNCSRVCECTGFLGRALAATFPKPGSWTTSLFSRFKCSPSCIHSPPWHLQSPASPPFLLLGDWDMVIKKSWIWPPRPLMLSSLVMILAMLLSYRRGKKTQTTTTRTTKGQGLRMVRVSSVYIHMCVRIWMKIGCTFILSLPALFNHFPARRILMRVWVREELWVGRIS